MDKEDYRFKDYEEFFRLVGDKYLFPTSYGENIFDFSIEELYQHIKARLQNDYYNEYHLEETTPLRNYGVSKKEGVSKND